MKFSGNTVTSAIDIGLKTLKKSRKEVIITVISKERKGFFGLLGRREAVVEIMPSNQEQPPSENLEKDKKQLLVETEFENKKPKSNVDEVIQNLGHYLADVTKKLNINTDIDVIQEKRTVYYTFDTNLEGLLIGRHGRTLNSLQLLAQDYFDRHKNNNRRVRIILNVANYRERRKETLNYLARQKAHEAYISRTQVALESMPSFERKIVHAALAKNANVRTFSKGADPNRRVIIEPIRK